MTSWMNIGDVRIKCKSCNNEMVFETSRNSSSVIYGCNNCKRQIFLKTDTQGDVKSQTRDGVLPPKKKDRFAILGGIVRSNSRDFYVFKLMCNDLDYIRKSKQENHWYFSNDGFMVTSQIGYFDKKEDEEEK